MIKRLVKFQFDDPTLSRLVDNIDGLFASVFKSQIIDGNLIKNVSFAANQDTVIATGLSRAYQGWFITDQTAFARFKRSSSTNNNKDSRIILVSDSDTVANIYVF